METLIECDRLELSGDLSQFTALRHLAARQPLMSAYAPDSFTIYDELTRFG